MRSFFKNGLPAKIIFAMAFLGGGSGINLMAQTLTPPQNAAILNTKQGGIALLDNYLTENLPNIDYDRIVLPGPQFIASDDPEYIRVPEAIALREYVQPGAVRLYLYNVNGVAEPSKMDRKITVVIRNTGKDILHLKMLKYSSQIPSSNYFQIGKQGLADYFASSIDNKIRTVSPGQAIPLDDKLEKNIVKYDELAHGIYEFTVDQPAEISIVQTSPSVSGPAAVAKIKNYVPRSSKNAGRGLFGVSNYRIVTKGVFDTRNGVSQIMLADGDRDPWIIGQEHYSGETIKFEGNYGVMYDIEMKWKSSDGKGLALITWNSRSGNSQWCGGMASSMVVSKGKFSDGIVNIPSDRLITKGAPEAVVVQIFPPDPSGKEQTIKLRYSPPGASCLPTPLIFIPIEMH